MNGRTNQVALVIWLSNSKLSSCAKNAGSFRSLPEDFLVLLFGHLRYSIILIQGEGLVLLNGLFRMSVFNLGFFVELPRLLQ